MKFWRRFWRRRALKRLLPEHTSAPGYEDLLLCVPIREELLNPNVGFQDRAKIIELVAGDAWRVAAQQVRERLPIKLPDRYGPRFKEGFSALS